MKRQAFLRLLGWGLLASQLPLQSLAQPPEAAQDTEAQGFQIRPMLIRLTGGVSGEKGHWAKTYLFRQNKSTNQKSRHIGHL